MILFFFWGNFVFIIVTTTTTLPRWKLRARGLYSTATLRQGEKEIVSDDAVPGTGLGF